MRRAIAVRSDQTLVDLHYALQAAFRVGRRPPVLVLARRQVLGTGRDRGHAPFALENDPFAGWDLPIAKPGRKSTERRRLDRLQLTKGQRIVYLFDFGDEWRVCLTLRQITADNGGDYPRLLESVGEAPPQYPDNEEEVDAA